MDKIKGIEIVINQYSNWKPSDIAFVKKIKWSKGKLRILFLSQDRSNSTIWPDFNNEFFDILIAFYNVSNLYINFNSSNIQQITGFDVVDVSSSQMENINFEVEDYENRFLSFQCKEIKIEKISEPKKIKVNND